MDDNARKKQDIWDAIGKLKLRDQLVLLFAVIGCGVLFAFLVFKFFVFTTNVEFHIPKSTLRATDSAQVHRQATYNDFPYTVVFPETDYSTTVGGEEGLHTNYVSAFTYDENHLLILGVFEDTVSINEFFTYALAGAIDERINTDSVVYTSMVHDEGYANAVPYIYEGGQLSANGDYYLVSYIYHTDKGKNLLMMALTNVANQDSVDKCKQLADKMIFSMARVSSESEEIAATDTSTVSNPLSGSPESDKYALDREAEDNMTTAEKMERIGKMVDESAYSVEYPDATDLEYYVLLTEDIDTAVFYIDYTEVKSVPELSYLKSPSGVKYAPTYNNGDGVGLVYWEIDKPPLGNWLIHLSKNAKYGQFFTGVLPKAEFESQYIENSNPQPRDGQ